MFSNKFIAALIAVTLASQAVEAMNRAPEKIRLTLMNATGPQEEQIVPVLPHQVLIGHTDLVTSLASFTHDGQHYIVSGSDDKTVRVWDVEKRECIHVFEGHTDSIQSLCIVPIDNVDVYIVSGSGDCTIRVWSFKQQACVATLKGHTAKVTSIKLIEPGACIIASCSWDKTVKAWDLYRCIVEPDHACIGTVHTDGTCLLDVERLEDHIVAAADYDSGNIYILDLVQETCLRTIKTFNQQVICMKAMTDNRMLVWDYGCVVYNWKTGEECYSFIKQNDAASWGIQAMATCPDYDNQVMFEKFDGHFYVYDYVSGELKAILNVGEKSSFEGIFWLLTVIDGKLVYSSCLENTDPNPNNIYISPNIR